MTSTESILRLAIRWLVLALGVWVAAEVVGGIHLDGWESALAVALILGLLNLYVRPVLRLLTFPLTILTLGLFLIVINAALLGLASWIASWFNSIHFSVDNVGSAILGALIISAVGIVVGIFVDPDRIARDLTGRL